MPNCPECSGYFENRYQTFCSRTCQSIADERRAHQNNIEQLARQNVQITERTASQQIEYARQTAEYSRQEVEYARRSAEHSRQEAKFAQRTAEYARREAEAEEAQLQLQRDEIAKKEADEAFQFQHDLFYTRECPQCAEIIKRKAKSCVNCEVEILDWESQRATIEQWEIRAQKFDLLPWEYEKIEKIEAEVAFWLEIINSIEHYLHENDILEDLPSKRTWDIVKSTMKTMRPDMTPYDTISAFEIFLAQKFFQIAKHTQTDVSQAYISYMGAPLRSFMIKKFDPFGVHKKSDSADVPVEVLFMVMIGFKPYAQKNLRDQAVESIKLLLSQLHPYQTPVQSNQLWQAYQDIVKRKRALFKKFWRDHLIVFGIASLFCFVLLIALS